MGFCAIRMPVPKGPSASFVASRSPLALMVATSPATAVPYCLPSPLSDSA